MNLPVPETRGRGPPTTLRGERYLNKARFLSIRQFRAEPLQRELFPTALRLLAHLSGNFFIGRHDHEMRRPVGCSEGSEYTKKKEDAEACHAADSFRDKGNHPIDTVRIIKKQGSAVKGSQARKEGYAVTETYKAEIEDTYAEAFRSICAEVLVTARDRKWVDHAIAAATGNASSTILCDCEAGLDRYVGPGGDENTPTPDNRPGALLQFHVPRFRKDRVEALQRSLLVRISQNVLTCPAASCFCPVPGENHFPLGRKLAYFGDGYQYRDERWGRRVWVVPILGGEFVIDRRFGYHDGLMGGNLWFMGRDLDAALLAAERAESAVRNVAGVITPFPGGIAASGSKAGSRYKFSVASTFEAFCPTLREKLGDKSRVPEGVGSIMEIIINGKDLATITQATQAAIAAAVDTPGLLRISAGNYGGRLGKSFIYLLPERHP
jgi:formylmethanofuran--tetrahydromethanopterin N-formyltransferase